MKPKIVFATFIVLSFLLPFIVEAQQQKGRWPRSKKQTPSGATKLKPAKSPGRFIIIEFTPNGSGGEMCRVHLRSLGDRFISFYGGGAAYQMTFALRRSGASDTCMSGGAEHVFDGKVSLQYGPEQDYTFESDPNYPLTFKFVEKAGYVYLCGRGTVTTKEGKIHRLGHADTVNTWVPRLSSNEQLDREGATQALGWLPRTLGEKSEAVMSLIKALRDKAMEVRRNAAESLGRTGDERAVYALTALLGSQREKEEWVRAVAEESLGIIRAKNAAARLPDKAAFAVLTESLKHKQPLVRQTAAEGLAKGGAEAFEPLIIGLGDESSGVRVNAARSLASIGDVRAADPLKQALVKEKDGEAKKAIDEAIKKLVKN